LLPGNLRHCYATWGEQCGTLVTIEKDKGIPRALMVSFMGHSSDEMIKRHYFDGCPPMAKLPINLFHPEDPPLSELKVSNRKRLKLVGGG
jgi:hypothetical protein